MQPTRVAVVEAPRRSPEAAEARASERSDAAAGAAPASKAADTPPAPVTLWTFRAAAPTSGSASVDTEGNVYISTTEGYVHSLTSEGQFRWSYTVSGMPMGSPQVDEHGHIFLTTNAPRVYALRSDGHLHWVKKVQTAIATPAVLDGGILYFGSRNGQVHALGSNSTWLWHRRIPAKVDHAPSVSSAGVFVPTRKGAWLLDGRNKRRLSQAPRSSRPALASPKAWLLESNGLVQAFPLGGGKTLWKSEGRNMALEVGGEKLVVEQDEELVWLSVAEGRPLGAVALPDRLSAPPLALASGVVVAPLSSGQLLVAHRTDSRTALIAAGLGPPRTPTWDAARRRVIVVGGDGSAVSVSLQQWLAEDSVRPEPTSQP